MASVHPKRRCRPARPVAEEINGLMNGPFRFPHPAEQTLVSRVAILKHAAGKLQTVRPGSAVEIGAIAFVTDLGLPPGELAVAVEAHGLRALFVTEHTHLPIEYGPPPWGEPLGPEYQRTLDPFVTLAIAAERTTSIRLGTGICSSPCTIRSPSPRPSPRSTTSAAAGSNSAWATAGAGRNRRSRRRLRRSTRRRRRARGGDAGTVAAGPDTVLRFAGALRSGPRPSEAGYRRRTASPPRGPADEALAPSPRRVGRRVDPLRSAHAPRRPPGRRRRSPCGRSGSGDVLGHRRRDA